MKIVTFIFSPFATSVILTILGIFITRIFQNKPKLIAHYGYISQHKIRLPENENIPTEMIINTHAIVIRNNGNMPANNVQVSHDVLPDYQIQPMVKYEVSNLPDGGKEIVFPVLVAKESITISYLYFPPLNYKDIRHRIKSNEGFAKTIDVIPARNLPAWLKGLLYLLLLIGLITIFYWGEIALIWVSKIIS